MPRKTQPTATPANDFAIVKSNLDLAWEKVQSAIRQEAEGRKLWIEGTLELINILDGARKRLGSDQAFGKWLTENDYGENRITRHDRAALLNMAEHLEDTRKVLEQTHRRSWRLIWEEEIQPGLPNAGQPKGGGEPKASTRRSKKKGAKREANGEQKPEGLRDMRGWLNQQVAAVNAVIDEVNKVMTNCTREQHSLLNELEPDLLLEAFQNGVKKSSKFKNWVSLPWKEAAAELISRVKRTFARRTPEQQPEA